MDAASAAELVRQRDADEGATFMRLYGVPSIEEREWYHEIVGTLPTLEQVNEFAQELVRRLQSGE
jgi:hypothetical protein